MATGTLLLVLLFIAHAQSQPCPNGQPGLPPSMCMQACNSTNCNMSCSGIAGMCMQQCQDFGSCPMVNCNSAGQCMQMCSRDCGSFTCKTENCTQSCQGSCKRITCDSQRCMQLCEKGGCIMECTDKAQSCQQSCIKDCTFICNAKDPATQCQQTCQQGGCKYEGAPMNKTTCDVQLQLADPDQCMQSGCPYKDCYMECSRSTISQKQCIQICQPPRSLCPKAMSCDTTNCTQTCLGECESAECSSFSMCVQQCGGKCKSTRCTSKICNQQCLDGACALNCADGTEKCIQTCNGTSCSSLISHASEEERQFCPGNCDNMQCNSPNCTQVTLKAISCNINDFYLCKYKLILQKESFLSRRSQTYLIFRDSQIFLNTIYIYKRR